MSCEGTVERTWERLLGTATEDERHALERHLATCAPCRLEAAEIETLWSELGRFDDEDVPTERMRARFRAALDAGRADAAAGAVVSEAAFADRFARAFELVWPRRPAVQAAFAAATLFVGLVAGMLLDPDRGARAEIRALRAEMHEVNRTVAVALLEHDSASERLRGVELGRRTVDDERVTEALLAAVRHDPNVNVRLAALGALAGSLDRPAVARSLVETLPRERSPFVQVALAETLVAADVPGSDTAIRELLERSEPGAPLDAEARRSLSELMKENG